MFVVRLKRPHEDFDFKAFNSHRDAVARFRAAQREMIDGDVDTCALFDVDATDAESALAMASQGKARLVESDLSDGPSKVHSNRRSAR